jgi:hypothetical protein
MGRSVSVAAYSMTWQPKGPWFAPSANGDCENGSARRFCGSWVLITWCENPSCAAVRFCHVGLALQLLVAIISAVLMLLAAVSCAPLQMVDTSRYCMTGEPTDQCAERQVR